MKYVISKTQNHNDDFMAMKICKMNWFTRLDISSSFLQSVVKVICTDKSERETTAQERAWKINSCWIVLQVEKKNHDIIKFGHNPPTHNALNNYFNSDFIWMEKFTHILMWAGHHPQKDRKSERLCGKMKTNFNKSKLIANASNFNEIKNFFPFTHSYSLQSALAATE